MIKFIVDSTFGIEKDYAIKHDIHVVDLKLTLDGETTSEGYKEEWDEFYNRYKVSKNFPSSSQPNPYDFEQAIEAIYLKDPDSEIIILTIASALSGTVNSARLAATNFEGKKIEVIDSMEAATAQLLMLEELVEATNNGKTLQEVVELAEELKKKMAIYFIPDSMKYLLRSGRVSKVAALIASIAIIKPIFEFKNNVVSVPKKTFGLESGIREMIKRIPQKVKRIALGFIYDDKNVPLAKKLLKEERGIEDVRVCPVSPVFGVHVGIGAFGFTYISE